MKNIWISVNGFKITEEMANVLKAEWDENNRLEVFNFPAAFKRIVSLYFNNNMSKKE